MKARIFGSTPVLAVSVFCFGILVLLTAAAATADAQTRSIPSFIYGIDSNGALKAYRHNGAATGVGLETAGAWEGPNDIGSGWNDYKTVFAGGGGIIYAIKADGTLEWRQLQGIRDGSDPWGKTRIVGLGWGDFDQVFPGGDGIIYAITHEGKLLWYKHNAYLTGGGLERPGAWEGPKEVGTGWNGFEQVFSAGGGIMYVIERNGKLRWYRHNGYLTGLGTPGAWEGPKAVGTGWNGFEQVFAAGAGIIYVVERNGKLRWYKHNGYLSGTGTPGAWEGPKEVGTGWNSFVKVFALLQGPALIDAERQRRRSDSDEVLGSRGGPFEKKPDPGRYTPFQPENSIRVRVRYKKELGYVGDSNAFGSVGPTSCSAFSVSVVIGDGSAQRLNPTRVSSDSKMEDAGGYYICNYLLSDIPLNQPTRISVSMSGANQFAAWKGGSQAQPPPLYQRTVINVDNPNNAPVTLTAAQARGQQLFEMVYVASPR